MEMDSALWELTETGDADEVVSVIVRLKDPNRIPDAITPISCFGDVITGRLPISAIQETRRSELVESMKATKPVLMRDPVDDEDLSVDDEQVAELPRAVEATERLPEDGTGVIVGIADWGLDFTHPNFRNEDGTTRVLALWDQRGKGPSPEPWGYGTVHTRDAINAALARPDPFAALGYDLFGSDRSGRGTHGTHVTDILAGNRREPGSVSGLASGAGIVFVHLASLRIPEPADFGDSVSLLEALDFIRTTADERPCVINVSAGKTGGEKRGTNPFDRAVDAMLLGRDNIALVQSVGNYGSARLHTHGRVRLGRCRSFIWQINEGDRTPNELEVWYSGLDIFDVTLVAPDGQRFSVALGERLRLESGGEHWGNLYHRANEPNSGMNHFDAILRPVAPGGEWHVELVGRDVVDGRFHAWIERDAGGRHQSRFAPHQATSTCTTNTISTSYRAIAVGAHDDDFEPPPFTSQGPTADGRLKPEVSAPGRGILAARSMPARGWREGESRLRESSGTSMASPHVAGTVALMYQAAGRPLTITELRSLLINSTDPIPGQLGGSPRLGYGYLNTRAAVAAARQVTQGALLSTAFPARIAAGGDNDDFEDEASTEFVEYTPGDEDIGDEGFLDERCERPSVAEASDDLEERWSPDGGAGEASLAGEVSLAGEASGNQIDRGPLDDLSIIDAEAAFRSHRRQARSPVRQEATFSAVSGDEPVEGTETEGYW